MRRGGSYYGINQGSHHPTIEESQLFYERVCCQTRGFSICTFTHCIDSRERTDGHRKTRIKGYSSRILTYDSMEDYVILKQKTNGHASDSYNGKSRNHKTLIWNWRIHKFFASLIGIIARHYLTLIKQCSRMLNWSIKKRTAFRSLSSHSACCWVWSTPSEGWWWSWKFVNSSTPLETRSVTVRGFEWFRLISPDSRIPFSSPARLAPIKLWCDLRNKYGNIIRSLSLKITSFLSTKITVISFQNFC